jgi:hypothetical protein
MQKFQGGELEKGFERFERAATKGHEESIWIGSVVKDVAMEKNTLKQAFAKTEEPLGWYFAGKFAGDEREYFDFCKKSAEGGCSWGQVEFGWYFGYAKFVEEDEKAYVEWLEKAVSQNNPRAMDWLGDWFCDEVDDKEKAVLYFRDAAELGWKRSMSWLANMLRKGEGCEKDLRQAVIWGAKGDSDVFWKRMEAARQTLESRAMEDLDCDFNPLCYLLGWGLYWYQYGSEDWNEQEDEDQAFGNRCLDYYCSCVDMQQKSIFTFLLGWNRATAGVKGPGQMIAKMVWEWREDNLVKTLVKPPRRSPRVKRIKK